MDTLNQFASVLVAEAEQQQLVRRLQKAQKLNTELTQEVESAARRLGRLRHERNLLMDRMYEREVATLEFTSGSSDEEEAPLPTKKPMGRTTAWTLKDEVDVESATKKKRIVKTAEAAALTPRKVVPVATDEEGHVILPITIGVVTLHEAGQIVHDRPAFHNKRYIWPIGYHSSRPYMSAIDAEAQTVYHSRIVDGGAGPVFDVSADDNPDQHYQSPTPTGAWTAIVKQCNAVRGREYANSASGPDFFGLANPTISMVIEKLPDSEKCVHYQKKVYHGVGAAVSDSHEHDHDEKEEHVDCDD
jgi:hypothetical protein